MAVGSVPDDIRGELACAYIVLRDGARASAEEIVEATKTSLAPYKRPRLVRFVTDLPRTSSGKIMRRKLLEHAEAAGAPPPVGPGAAG